MHHGIPDGDILLRLQLAALEDAERKRRVTTIRPEEVSCGYLAYYIAQHHPWDGKARETWEKAAYDRFASQPQEINPHFEAARNMRLYYLSMETDHILRDAPIKIRNHMAAQYALHSSEGYRRSEMQFHSDSMYIEFALSFDIATSTPSPVREMIAARLQAIAKGKDETNRRRANYILERHKSPE